MDLIDYILGFIFIVIPLYLIYRDKQNKPSDFVNTKTGRRLSEKLIDEEDRDKKNGVYTEYYENGQKEFERIYKDGKRDGLQTNWFENGQKKEEGTYKDGKKDGKWTKWYENGQKEIEETYKDRELEVHTEWSENGQKCYESIFKDGKEISEKEWNSDGSVKE